MDDPAGGIIQARRCVRVHKLHIDWLWSFYMYGCRCHRNSTAGMDNRG